MEKRGVQRYKELRLGQLRAFCECVRQKSFTAAARELKRSHPAIWQQVRALERKFGVGLLERHGRQLEPSEDGLVFLELAGAILSDIDSLEDRFSQERSDIPRPLCILGSPAIITEDLHEPLAAFCRQYPQIKMTILGYVSRQALDFVTSGEVDLAVLPLHRGEPSARQIVAEPLCVRPAVLAVPEGHRLASKRKLTLADIVRYPLILPAADSFWRLRVDEVFRQAGLADQVKVMLEVSFNLALRRCVSTGLGIALLPLPVGAIELPGVRIRRVPDLLPSEEIVILWRRGAKPRPQARLFADFVRERLAGH